MANCDDIEIMPAWEVDKTMLLKNFDQIHYAYCFNLPQTLMEIQNTQQRQDSDSKDEGIKDNNKEYKIINQIGKPLKISNN